MSYVSFKNVKKIYEENKNEVIKNFNLSIDKGEFIVIVGPSGSGKSTLLELICGFEEITKGTIEIDNKIINEIEPKNRDVSMVFQNYALFPHLTVYENIAFGMNIRKEKKSDIKEKVKWAANILQLEEYLNVKPKQLSGGQRQRVALARAMVREPKLFLMDEPLSNLDSKLRYATCNEITSLHKKLKATTIYVTHDQVEALTMADRLVILNNGNIEQIGTPKEVYEEPENIFVATFMGKPQMNLLPFKIKDNNMVVGNDICISVNEKISSLEEEKEYILGIRAENIKESQGENGIRCEVRKIDYLGGEVVVYLRCGEYEFTFKTYELKDFNVGDFINVEFDISKIKVFDKETKERVR